MKQTLFNQLNELIIESSVNSNIKFLQLTPTELCRWKDCDVINIIRPYKNGINFALNDLIKTEFHHIYKITDIQLINDLHNYKHINILEQSEINELNTNAGTYVYMELTQYKKQKVKRFFYDCEFDETPYGIKLISIGIVDENNNELYLINKDFNWDLCTNQWLIKNVKSKIISQPDFYKVNMAEIARRVLKFLNPSLDTNLKLYGWYSAYDHVCFCQLFGKMINLPERLTNVYK